MTLQRGRDAAGDPGRYAGRRADDSWLDLAPARATDDLEDPWAWADRDTDGRSLPDTSTVEVTAVLVTLDAERWLPETLAALAGLQRRPDRLVAIDNGSADGTRTLLERARDTGLVDAVYDGQRGQGFGAAVRSALRQDHAAHPDGRGGRDRARWLWLLHDDAAPAPDALTELLAHVLTEPDIDITGPKLLLPRHRQARPQLSEVGVSISETGRRELDLEVGEIDQGQHDIPQPRLGVSTCGLLVRLSVWHDLDGLDPAIPVFRDGVEFGWRAHLHGYRVVTTPQARMTHRQVGRAGLRPRSAVGRRPARTDRVLGMLVVAGHAPTRRLPLVWLRLLWSCLLHAVGYLLGKVPGRAWDELAALATFAVRPGRLRAMRSRTAALDPLPGSDEVVRSLRPPRWHSLRVAAEVISGAASVRYRKVAGDADAATLDELTGDEFSSVADERPRNAWLSAPVLALLALVVASLVAARGLYGSGALAGPALLPAPDTLGALWRSAWSPIAGAPDQVSPPWLALTAVGATLLVGQPDWFVTLLVLGAVPLAALAAYPAVRQHVHDLRVRLFVTTTYALLPVLLGGAAQGRLALGVVAVVLPLLVVTARAIALRRVRAPEAWRGGWGAGVVLVVLLAFVPSLAALVLLLALLSVGPLRRSARKLARVGIALGLPLLVLAPWLPSLVAAPGRALVGPDAALDGVTAAPQVWELLLGRPAGPGLPPLWVSLTVLGLAWLVAAAGLLLAPRRRVVGIGWVTALLAFAGAVGLSRLVVAVPPVGVEVRPWAGEYLLVGFGALLLAGGAGVDGLSARLRRRSFSLLQPAAVLVGVAVTLVTVGSVVWWAWTGVRGPLERPTLDGLPSYVVNALRSDARPRVLAIDLSTDVARYSVLAGDQVRLGDADRGLAYGGSAAARDQAEDLVARLVAGAADSGIAPELRSLGVGYLVVSGADTEEQARIDNTPGLGTASGDEGSVVWQLEPAVSRTTLVADGESVPVGPSPAAVPPAATERRLLIGEPADPRWRAELDGRALSSAAADWQQAFAVPAAGGTLRYRLDSVAPWLLIGQGLVLAVAAVLAAPGVRQPEVRDPTRYARRAATAGEL